MIPESQRANSERDPILVGLTRKQSGLFGYILSLVLIGITTSAILRIQEAVMKIDHVYTTPILWFTFPILIIALIGGRGPGIFSLILSEICLLTIVDRQVPASQALHIGPALAYVGLPLIGSVLIVGMDALRSNTQLLKESEAAQARMRALIGSAPVGVALLSPSGETLFANTAFEEIWGLTSPFTHVDQLRGFLVSNAVGEHSKFSQTPYGRVISGAVSAKQEEIIIQQPTHDSIWADVRATMVRDAKGRPLGTLLIASNINERKLAEMQVLRSTHREAVIAKIGADIKNAEAPESIQQTAVSLVCKTLGVDRCCFAQYDFRTAELTVGPDYSRAGIKSVAGDYDLKPGCIPEAHAFVSGSPVAVHNIKQLAYDDDLRKLADHLGAQSMIIAGIADDPLVRSVLLICDGKQRHWSSDEISLVRTVAEQVRHATVSAVLRLREHKIATVLQEALRPTVPREVPALKINHYYQPALDEAIIGGDFVDVFKADPDPDSHRWAIVIGDVAGKGLTAASQVSTVRTMLRYALTQGGRMASVIGHLSDTLAAREWIVGFATAFIGIFDGKTLEMEYVSCGHEAGFLRRGSDNRIDELSSTGIALGAFEGGVFESRIVRLERGDMLLLYTDGVTDVGPDRSTLLGPAGVKSIISGAAPDTSGAEVIDLIRGHVDDLTGGVLHDDVCMIALMVTEDAHQPEPRVSSDVDSVEAALQAAARGAKF